MTTTKTQAKAKTQTPTLPQYRVLRLARFCEAAGLWLVAIRRSAATICDPEAGGEIAYTFGTPKSPKLRAARQWPAVRRLDATEQSVQSCVARGWLEEVGRNPTTGSRHTQEFRFQLTEAGRAAERAGGDTFAAQLARAELEHHHVNAYQAAADALREGRDPKGELRGRRTIERAERAFLAALYADEEVELTELAGGDNRHPNLAPGTVDAAIVLLDLKRRERAIEDELAGLWADRKAVMDAALAQDPDAQVAAAERLNAATVPAPAGVVE